jgi:hypothetical protein
MNCNNYKLDNKEFETDDEIETDDESETDDERNEFEKQLDKFCNKYEILHYFLFDDYFGFLCQLGYDNRLEELDYFDDDIRELYLEHLNKIMGSLEVKCDTKEHFIDILIKLEDYICECPFYNEEDKHNEYIKIAEYRINFMTEKNV